MFLVLVGLHDLVGHTMFHFDFDALFYFKNIEAGLSKYLISFNFIYIYIYIYYNKLLKVCFARNPFI